MQGYQLDFGAHQVICREGDPSTDIYYLKSGSLLVCAIQGTKVTALAKIEAGEFMGELSFFDGKTRASHVVTLEPSQMVQIPKHELSGLLPFWYQQIGKSLTKKIRMLDEVVNKANVRKFGSQEQKPLTIEEQRTIYAAITHQDT